MNKARKEYLKAVNKNPIDYNELSLKAAIYIFELEKVNVELIDFVNEVVENKDVYGNYNHALFLSKKYKKEEPFMNKKAFEVEDIGTRKNYTFVLDAPHVFMYDTSRGSGNRLLTTMPEDNAAPDESLFPFGCDTAEEYYDHMHQKALGKESTFPIYFLGFVNPETFQPEETNDETNY